MNVALRRLSRPWLRHVHSRALCSAKVYENILSETRGAVGVITLNRPKALNSLSPELMAEVACAAKAFDADTSIGAIVLTGSGHKVSHMLFQHGYTLMAP